MKQYIKNNLYKTNKGLLLIFEGEQGKYLTFRSSKEHGDKLYHADKNGNLGFGEYVIGGKEVK